MHAGTHLAPEDFHAVLASAASAAAGGGGRETVVLDCRNVYETNIGHFSVVGISFSFIPDLLNVLLTANNNSALGFLQGPTSHVPGR